MSGANIFDIKRFGIYDGAGIRTVFFIKGCPLNCAWCHNPEGISPAIRVWHMPRSCMKCGACIGECPEKALGWDELGVVVSGACNNCGRCVSICPTGALRFDAREMTVAEAMLEVEKDSVFYDTSGGGVTLSGGECTMSPEFSLELLAACRKRGVNTAIETCLHAPPEVLHSFSLAADRIIADIKLADPGAHEAATGADNTLILENLQMLAESDCDLLLRVPLIPGYTATDDNIKAIGEIISALPRPVPVELINYNPMGREKYRAMRREYPVTRSSPLEAPLLDRYRKMLDSY